MTQSASGTFQAFLGICFLLTLTPGADTALILNVAIRSGAKRVLQTTLGICSGLLFHATLSALGLSVVLRQSPKLFTGIKWLGALYLTYLGAKSLYEAIHIHSQRESTDKNQMGSFKQGALTNVLNPKVAVFYLTFLPQFVNPDKNVLLQSLGLACVHIAMSMIWLLSIGHFVSFFKTWLVKPIFRRTLEILTGFALIGFGAKLAWF